MKKANKKKTGQELIDECVLSAIKSCCANYVAGQFYTSVNQLDKQELLLLKKSVKGVTRDNIKNLGHLLPDNAWLNLENSISQAVDWRLQLLNTTEQANKTKLEKILLLDSLEKKISKTQAAELKKYLGVL